MNAEQILQGIIPIDRELIRCCTRITQEEAIATNLKNGLRKAMTKHGVYLYEYSRQPEKHDRALNSIMSSCNDLIGIMGALIPTDPEAEQVVSWENRREFERILIARAAWVKAYEDRSKNGVLIFDSTGKEVVN